MDGLATDWCNGDISEERYFKGCDDVLNRVNEVLNFRVQDIPVFFNSDPRGYALKISDKYTKEKDLQIEKDWGGYGIISPDYS